MREKADALPTTPPILLPPPRVEDDSSYNHRRGRGLG